MIHEVTLGGCRPEPLASYLAGLGVFRIVAEQADPRARASWRGDALVLASRLDADELVAFLAAEYTPTPIVAPWNGGSGFHPKDNTDGIDAITATHDRRFEPYRRAIKTSRAVLARLGMVGKPDKDSKVALLEALRAELDDAALAWFDAALVLVSDGPKYPPLLGTGGNDGRLDFTNNQMQRLATLLLEPTPHGRQLLRACLFGAPARGLEKGAVGQFHPSAAGGANAGPGFTADSLVNPWTYVFLMEGALQFAAAATRRLESVEPGALAYPFSVRAAGVGYGTAGPSDESQTRNEIWLPLWRRPARLPEIRALFGEGRATVAGRRARPAATAVDFARAVATLGVDRGIDEFVRYGFHVRNGLAYFATPLGRWRVRWNRRADLLSDVDEWFQSFRRVAASGPQSLRRALSSLEAAIMDLCRHAEPPPRAVAQVLVALGAAEAALSRSRKTTAEGWVRPVPPLAMNWLDAADDGSAEFRLAASLASTGLRERVVRVRPDARGRPCWAEQDDGRTVWTGSGLCGNLVAVLRRRQVEVARKEGPAPAADAPPAELERRSVFARLGDVRLFVDALVDDERLEELLRGLVLLDWRAAAPELLSANDRDGSPPSGFALLYLASEDPRRIEGALRAASRSELKRLPAFKAPENASRVRNAALLARAAAGDAWGATGAAARRLRGWGLVPLCDAVREPPMRARRLAAALAFAIDKRSVRALVAQVIRPSGPNVEESSP